MSTVTDSEEGSILHRGVIGVLTGLTSTLSRCSYADADSLVRRKGPGGRDHTSSSVFALSNSHPTSITSAESLVTYTPCSSHVVATWMTTYRSIVGQGHDQCVVEYGVGFFFPLNQRKAVGS